MVIDLVEMVIDEVEVDGVDIRLVERDIIPPEKVAQGRAPGKVKIW